MTTKPPTLAARFPLLPALGGLLLLGAATYGIAGLTLPMTTDGRAIPWTSALLWAPAAAVVGAAVLLFFLVAVLWRLGPTAAAAAWLLAMLPRMVLAWAAGWYAKFADDWSGLSVALALALFYLPVLALEAAVIAAACWRSSEQKPRSATAFAGPIREVTA